MSPLQVQFVMAAYSELSLMSLMSQGLHALPVLQVNAHVRALGGYVGHPFIHGTPVGQQPSAGHRHATLPFWQQLTPGVCVNSHNLRAAWQPVLERPAQTKSAWPPVFERPAQTKSDALLL